MSTDNVLTDEQILQAAQCLTSEVGIDGEYVVLKNVNGCIRAIEQAVLQSEQVQALRKDAERLDFLIAEECQVQALSLANGTKYRLYWPESDETQCEWYANPRAAIDSAIDAAMEKQK